MWFSEYGPLETIPNGVGSLDGGPGGGSLPIVWYDNTANDSMDYEYVVLPTMGDAGTGEALGVGAHRDSLCVAGWSAALGGVKHAVAWTADSVHGPYALELMGDYGPSYPSQANDVVGDDAATGQLHAVGWAVTPGGLTLPQEWKRDTLGVWTGRPVPLPIGAAEGGVNSLQDAGRFAIACGWCADSFGEKHAALWTKAGEVAPWSAHVLEPLDGYLECAALGVSIKTDEIVPDSSFDIFAVGTSNTGDDSVATLWKRDYLGTVTVHNLEDLLVNTDELDLSLRIATDIDVGGPESLLVVTGWGAEMGGMSPLTLTADPHAFLLIDEAAGAWVRGRDLAPISVTLATSPNPFSSGVTVSYSVGQASAIRLVVYDVAGRHVATLVDSRRDAGTHATTWDGLNARGLASPPGIYFCRFEVGKQSLTQKMVFLR
jgi:hypothetical protein